MTTEEARLKKDKTESNAVSTKMDQLLSFIKRVRSLKNFPWKNFKLILQSANQPELLWQFMPTGTREQYPQDTIELINLLGLHNGDIPLTASLSLFAFRGGEISPEEAKGIVFLISLIEEVDELIDSSKVPITNGSDELRNKLLLSIVNLNTIKISMMDILTKCLASFPEGKRTLIIDFLQEMIEFHSSSQNKSNPGTYGFKEAREYRIHTSVKFASLIRTLCNSTYTGTDRSDQFFLVAQFFDDAGDWQEDALENSYNLLWGIANDLKTMNGDLGFDFMVQLAGGSQDKKISVAELFRYPQLKNVRNHYLRELRRVAQKGAQNYFRKKIGL